ncbi:hypothetical protein ACS0TY_010411 [Phlomoides rotata]
MTSNIKKGAKVADKARVMNLFGGDTSSGHIEEAKYKQSYVSWNKEMDRQLANVLAEQMVLGHKCDGDTWKPQALQAVSGFTWDEERKMIVVTTDEWSAWASYVESHPEAKGMQNKMIDNWDEIVLLCGKDRAMGQTVETHDAVSEEMGEDDEIEVSSVPISGAKAHTRPSSSIDSMMEKTKKPKQDSMVDVVGKIASSFQEFLANKKNEEKPSGIEIRNVVKMIPELSGEEVFKAVRKLMSGDPDEFKLLKARPDEEKKEWIGFLINS